MISRHAFPLTRSGVQLKLCVCIKNSLQREAENTIIDLKQNMTSQDSKLGQLQNEWKEMFQKTLPAAATSKSGAQVIHCSRNMSQNLSNALSPNGQSTWITALRESSSTPQSALIRHGWRRSRAQHTKICPKSS